MAKKKKDMSWLLDEADENTVEVIDANGNPLQDGDSVAAIKDIKVKGTSDIKRGDKFKNIRLTEDPELIESGKMVLRREFFKKI
ncbi:MAG: alkylphosphonate utilization protein [Candidatus Gracilibacteria bacterium]|nr:alkylphosphonate utilization protein [Candidatus Gracilibacteria bacterium]